MQRTLQWTQVYRGLLLLPCLLLAGCDEGNNAVSAPVKTNITIDPLSEIKARLAFTCEHENFPEPSADANVLFKYARWLQVNNQLKEDKAVEAEIERLYRIAAENGHAKASINLQNGSLRGHFSLTAGERLRMSQQLIAAQVASGYYFIAIYLEHGVAGLQQDAEKALRYYRKAADEGNPQAQAYVGKKLAPVDIAPDIARQMRRCAAEQGDGEAARALGTNFETERQYQDALEVFQLGVAAGDEISAYALERGFDGTETADSMFYLGQTKDPERARRYKEIGRVLGNYSYAHPSVPEINDIVPLPPAELPAWDGKLKWLEAREANIQPTRPSDALIAQLARNKKLNPTTGKPLPESEHFDTAGVAKLLCYTGEACPKSGYWQRASLPHIGSNDNAIRYFDQGDIMPTDTVVYYQPRIWPLSSKRIEQQQQVDWRFLAEA